MTDSQMNEAKMAGERIKLVIESLRQLEIESHTLSFANADDLSLDFSDEIAQLQEVAKSLSTTPAVMEGRDANLLDRCRHELTNLMDKLSRNEKAGWEGVQRRILLMSDLSKALSPTKDKLSGEGEE